MLQFVSELMVYGTLTQFEQHKMKLDLFTWFFFFSDCLQGGHVKAAQIRKQLLTIPLNHIQLMISWELLNLISKPATFDPLGFGMSCGEERGGVGSTHFPAVTTELCCSLMFVSGMTQMLWLWWAQISLTQYGQVRREREPQLSCKNTGKQLLQQPRDYPCLLQMQLHREKAGILEPIPPDLYK